MISPQVRIPIGADSVKLSVQGNLGDLGEAHTAVIVELARDGGQDEVFLALRVFLLPRYEVQQLGKYVYMGRCCGVPTWWC